MLYLTIGERNDKPRAQNTNIHGGKTLRLRDDGTVPPDNPFVGKDGHKPEIYSYGHRNAQGIAVHPQSGAIWVSEHGPQGGDELNVVQAGKNYGWPIVVFGHDYNGDVMSPQTYREGMEQPALIWTPSIGITGLMFYTGDRIPEWKGDVFVAGLSGQNVVRILYNSRGGPMGREVLLTPLKMRMRDVRQGPDGLIYVAVDANPGGILRIEPAKTPTTSSMSRNCWGATSVPPPAAARLVRRLPARDAVHLTRHVACFVRRQEHEHRRNLHGLRRAFEGRVLPELLHFFFRHR